MCVAIVSFPGDRLGAECARALGEADYPCLEIDASTLADCRVTLGKHRIEVNGREIDGLLFRAPTRGPFSESFVAEDQAFVNAEVAAVWMAVMARERVRCLNRFGAEPWCLGCRWIVWRRRLLEHGVSVAPMTFGSRSGKVAASSPGRDAGTRRWLPYENLTLRTEPPPKAAASLLSPLIDDGPFQRALLFRGAVVHGPDDDSLARAASVLYDQGIGLAQGLLDRDQALVAVDCLPDLDDEDLARLVPEVVAYYA